MKKLFVGIVLAAATSLSAAPKVLVYMLDGARADVLEHVNHPVWQALKANRWAEGYRSAWSITAGNEPFVLPASAPNHAVIATGRLARYHRVMDNKPEFYHVFSQSATPTWQERIGRKFPDIRMMQVFSWRPDLMFMPESGNYSIVCGNDVNNSLVLRELMKRKDAPAVLMVFDDAPDAGGHNGGYYPYTTLYLQRVKEAMQRFSDLLDAIKAQPTFAEDDWLIILCSDHGGIYTRHNIHGGQCNTVPLLYCGKHIPAGEIAGRPNNLGIAANVLRHMGLEAEVAQLDDPGVITVAEPSARPVTDGLLYDLVVRNGAIANRASGGGIATSGNLTVGADAFRTGSDGFLTLGGLKSFGGGALTFAITLKCNQGRINGDPVIFGNKNWNDGGTSGFAFIARRNKFVLNAGCSNAPVDYLVRSPRRIDLFDIVVDRGENLVAVSIEPNGLVTVYQRSASGVENWFCIRGANILTGSPLDWNIGQDGTGRYKHHADFEVARFRFWGRALTLDELRKLEFK